MCTLPPVDRPADLEPPEAYLIDTSQLDSEAKARPALLGGGEDDDGDGIPDAAERSGVAGEPLLDFPAFGAEPGVLDVFVQADWVGCDPLTEFCGPGNSLDFYQVSSQVAAEWAALYAPDIAVHIDNGLDPTDPALATVHGAWGGAHRLPPGPQECNADSLGPRYGYFHRGSHFGYGGGGQGTVRGYCFSADAGHGAVGAHELGHNLGVSHGGNLESYGVNCKPHYRSPMNYGYLYDSSIDEFSRGERVIALNGERMDEMAGLGVFDEAANASLTNSVWSLAVRDDGAVDWNRNGIFETEPVRASVTWAAASCEQSFAHSDGLERAHAPTLARLPAAGAEVARVYAFGRDPDTGVPGYWYATRFDDCDLSDATSKCTDWQPSVGDPMIAIPGALDGSGAIAGVGWSDGVRSHMTIVYTDAQGGLHSQDMQLDAEGVEVWQEPVPVAGGAAVTDGTPALSRVPDDPLAVVLVAPDSGRLITWTGQLDANGADFELAEPVEQRWDDGAPIEPCYGVALTHGYQTDMVEPGLYALIPAGPMCTLEFARLAADGSAWLRLTDRMWPDSQPPIVGGRPGLAYVPFTWNDPDGTPTGDERSGRFYIAYHYFPRSPGVIVMTEGNDPDIEAETLRMGLKSGGYMRHVWAVVDDGVTLYYDHLDDHNLRAIWTYAYGKTYFNPFADGIFNADMRDVDDYAVMRQYIACSLTRSCP